jgi:hypothetical protein
MKKVFTLIISLLLIFLVNNSQAQEEKEPVPPGWLVFSQNMVDGNNVAKVNELIDSVTVPIMQELIDEGKLIGWGQLNHAWGDEWNVNIYYIAESHKAFIEAWQEFIKRVNERFPDIGNEWSPLLDAHKDNMYFVRHMLMRN